MAIPGKSEKRSEVAQIYISCFRFARACRDSHGFPLMPLALRSDRPFDPRKSSIYYGWWIMAAGTLGMMSAVPGSPPGVSPFVDPMIEAYGGLDRASFSLAYTLGTLLTGIITFFIGERLDRLDLRVVCMTIYAAFGLSLVGLGSFDYVYHWLVPESAQAHWIAWSFLFVGFFLSRLTGMGLTMTLCRWKKSPPRPQTTTTPKSIGLAGTISHDPAQQSA